ncbi:MAG: DUF2029 domain-containing protein [Chloroflexota bacterium]
MNSKRPDLLAAALMIMAIILLAAMTWANFQLASQAPGGNDFVARWVGTRMYIMEGLSPYSVETSEAIQEFFYGRLAEGTEDHQLFVYPHYSMLVFAPFALISDFTLARSVWMTALEVGLIATIAISLALTGWRPQPLMLGLLILFGVIWYHGFRPVINGNAAVLVGFFIALTLLLIKMEWDRGAGVLLALSTVKPQMVVLLVPLIIFWALSNKRWLFIKSFMLAMLLLVGGSLLIEPDWIINNLLQVLFYPKYTEPGTLGLIFSVWWPGVGQGLGLIFSVLFSILIIIETILLWGMGNRKLIWTACLVLVITNLIGIRTATANFAALMPALILIFAEWHNRWGNSGQKLILVTMATLFAGLWLLFINTLEVGAGDQPIQNPILFFPLPIFLLVGLYWVRWWAVRPARSSYS